MNKKIKVICKTGDEVVWKAIQSLQGELKIISPISLKKLKQSIINNGFSFPFVVWRNKSTIYSIDGVHRAKALLELEKEGYEIPALLPAIYIRATDKTHAKKLILAATSQYAKTQEDELIEFLSDLNIEEINDEIEIPSIDLSRLTKEDNTSGGKEPELNRIFEVVISCSDEMEQEKLYNTLTEKGMKCRVLTL